MADIINNDFTKEFFIRVWPNGYSEPGYGIGNNEIVKICITPFKDKEKNVVEIGPGAGVFTRHLLDFKHIYLLDVVPRPAAIPKNENITFIELADQDFFCTGIEDNTIDFIFAHGVFCHLSNDALKTYMTSIHRILKTGGDCIFMIANIENTKKSFKEDINEFKLGDLLPMGHFYQSQETLDFIIDSNDYEFINRNMSPDHRDFLVHIKKK